jgi:hypothetical protein
MKTEYCVYRDIEFEDKTRAELENSRGDMQTLLDTWNSLNIGKCRDINNLLMRPEPLFNQVIDTLVTVPTGNGPFAVNKAVYVQSLNLPDPSALYATAKRVRQIGYCAVPALWRISDDGTRVELVESEAEVFIDRMSLYTSDADKIRMMKDLQHVCDLINSLNTRCGIHLIDSRDVNLNRWVIGKFKIRELPNYGTEISVDPELLKTMLKK